MRWHAVDTGAHEAFSVHALDVLGAPHEAAPGVTTGRLCPRCGSSSHGRPWLRVGDVAHHVSLSRSGPHLLTAIAGEPVGVDVESVAVVAARWDPALVLADGERADSDEDRARTWARKEAVLKRRGTGLATPMPEVVLAAETWHDLPAPPGYVAAISGAARGAAAP